MIVEHFCLAGRLRKNFLLWDLVEVALWIMLLIVSGEKVLNQGGLRYNDEFVRHKILDCVGDIYLSGYKIFGKMKGYQSGHDMTARLLKRNI